MPTTVSRRKRRQARNRDAWGDYVPSGRGEEGRVYKIDGSHVALDQAEMTGVDSREMKASAIINTARIDRDKEVIMPNGGNYDDYRRNPVVLWEHGFDENITTPIAKCRNRDGSLALRVTESSIEADSYFTDRDPVSSQIFALIDEGIVNATSIHVDPHPGSVETSNRSGERVTIFRKWDMIEWSWGNVGVNPDAVAKVLHRGRLGETKIVEPVAKTLRSLIPPGKTFRGWSPEEGGGSDHDIERELEVMKSRVAKMEGEEYKTVRSKMAEMEEAHAERMRQLDGMIAKAGLGTYLQAFNPFASEASRIHAMNRVMDPNYERDVQDYERNKPVRIAAIRETIRGLEQKIQQIQASSFTNQA